MEYGTQGTQVSAVSCTVQYTVHVLYCSLMAHRGHRAWELEKCVTDTQTTLAQSGRKQHQAEFVKRDPITS